MPPLVVDPSALLALGLEDEDAAFLATLDELSLPCCRSGPRGWVPRSRTEGRSRLEGDDALGVAVGDVAGNFLEQGQAGAVEAEELVEVATVVAAPQVDPAVGGAERIARAGPGRCQRLRPR